MTPGPNHQLLKQREGNWNLVVKMWMAPDAPPSESTATAEMKMIMGGRYLWDTTIGEFQGQPFEGTGITGYDNGKKKFVGIWVDNVGTGIMTGEGIYDADNREFHYRSTATDPMSGQPMVMHTVERIIDEDHWEVVSFNVMPDGTETKSMEIQYSRVGAPIVSTVPRPAAAGDNKFLLRVTIKPAENVKTVEVNGVAIQRDNTWREVEFGTVKARAVSAGEYLIVRGLPAGEYTVTVTRASGLKDISKSQTVLVDGDKEVEFNFN